MMSILIVWCMVMVIDVTIIRRKLIMIFMAGTMEKTTAMSMIMTLSIAIIMMLMKIMTMFSAMAMA